MSKKKLQKNLKMVKSMKMKRKLTCDSCENGLSQSVNDRHDIDFDIAPRKKENKNTS